MLSTKPDKLKETYEYLASKYGKQYIFKYASILNVNVDTIKNMKMVLNLLYQLMLLCH